MIHKVSALVGRSASQMRYGIAGSLALACGFQVILVAEAVRLAKTQSFGFLAGMLPEFLQRGLGDQLAMVASVKGTVIFGYFHPIVAVLIPLVALYVTTEPAHDVEARLVDLVLARSLPRTVLLTRSLALAAGYILAAMAVTAAGTWVGVRLFHAQPYGVPSWSLIGQLLGHLGAVAFSVAALGLCLAAFTRRRSTAFTTGALIVVLLYLVEFLASGSALLSLVAPLSPFHYYDAFAIAAGQAHETSDLAILLGAAAVLSAVAYWRFERRDL